MTDRLVFGGLGGGRLVALHFFMSLGFFFFSKVFLLFLGPFSMISPVPMVENGILCSSFALPLLLSPL